MGKYKRKYPPESYLDRDLNWLDFNAKVLAEAMNKDCPILERLNFCNIFRSNNDEFFMKRIGAIMKRAKDWNIQDSSAKRYSPDELSLLIRDQVFQQMEYFANGFNESILKELEKEGTHLLPDTSLTKADSEYINSYFRKNIYPILTPLAIDQGHPFPFLSNLSKSIAVVLSKPGNEQKLFARVKIPTEIPQWVRLSSSKESTFRYINIDTIITKNISDLFPGMEIKESFIFRVTRDAAIPEDGDDAEDKLGFVEEGLKERKFAPVVRLEYTSKANQTVLNYLKKELHLDEEHLFEMNCLANYTSLAEIYKYSGPRGKYPPFKPQINFALAAATDGDSFFKLIRKQDHLIHLPFDSFYHSVEAMVYYSALDPDVQAIKMILYRTDSDGRIIDALIKAAENKKQVAVIIELTARFDEERNIHWAQKLEEAGIHVSYGIMDYKTHAKMITIVRKERMGIRTYVNIGTGNFNSQTSKFYTDFSYFTCDPKIAAEVLEIFNYLTGLSQNLKFKKLFVAPFNMLDQFIKLIDDEIKFAKEGKPTQIIAKMNQLENPQIIDALYRASEAGVKIILYVRGFCCLIPQKKGQSSNITLYTIVGRFLEHSRVYYFSRGQQKDPLAGRFYIGSADWMSRNLLARVEVITPIKNPDQKKYLYDYLQLIRKDNQCTWELKNNGQYQKVKKEGPKFKIQDEMMKRHSSN